MKKLGKLQINSEKIMKDEELQILRGGYTACTCLCWTQENPPVILGYLLSENGKCPEDCDYAWEGSTGSCQC